MSLGNMRAQGVRSVWAECESCRHEAAVNVDRFADAVYVPDVALDLRCSKCRSKRITTWPNWKEHIRRRARDGGRSRAACSRRRSIQ